MGGWFSKKPEPKSSVTEQDRAVLKVKQQRDKVKVYEKKVKIQVERLTEQAKQMLKNGNKPKAAAYLRRRKFQQKLLEKAYGYLENLEGMISQMEQASIAVKVNEAMEAGNEILRVLSAELERAEDVMEEAKEMQQIVQEAQDVLSAPQAEFDEETVLKEFFEFTGVDLAAEEAEAEPAAAAAAATPQATAEELELPSPPSDEPLVLPTPPSDVPEVQQQKAPAKEKPQLVPA
eukprot:m.131563 g.131563  ORF g.131563 m.131563 type:complete len:233 (+) comp13918_c0_seq1:166-864(+)